MGDAPSEVAPDGAVRYVPAAALVARRRALIGGFDPDLRVGEDVDLVWRLHDEGWRVRYEPSVTVFHHEPSSWPQLLGRRFRYGTSAGPLAKRHPGRLVPVELRPWPTAAAVAWLTGRRRTGLATVAALGRGPGSTGPPPRHPTFAHPPLERGGGRVDGGGTGPCRHHAGRALPGGGRPPGKAVGGGVPRAGSPRCRVVATPSRCRSGALVVGIRRRRRGLWSRRVDRMHTGADLRTPAPRPPDSRRGRTRGGVWGDTSHERIGVTMEGANRSPSAGPLRFDHEAASSSGAAGTLMNTDRSSTSPPTIAALLVPTGPAAEQSRAFEADAARGARRRRPTMGAPGRIRRGGGACWWWPAWWESTPTPS